MSQRDRALERNFLSGTDPHFAARVVKRLDVAGAELGRDLPEHRDLAELVGEVRQECEDIAGWLLVTLQVAATRLSSADLTELRRDAAVATDLAHTIDCMLAAAVSGLNETRLS